MTIEKGKINILMNTKNHEVYSDKFVLRVLNLNRIDDATEEEKEILPKKTNDYIINRTIFY